MPTETKLPELKLELKQVKHTFTPEERNQIGGDLARAVGSLRNVEAEFDQVKASYKAKTTAGEAQIDSLSTALVNGFDMRNKKCVVVFRPRDRKKDFYLEDGYKAGSNGELASIPVITEDMTPADFQADLIQAESKFDKREEIALFKPQEGDSGFLIVGKFGGKWFSALRVTIGKLSITERLDSEQRCFKVRLDAIKDAIKRVSKWSKENLKDLADGFQAGFDAAVEANKERVE